MTSNNLLIKSYKNKYIAEKAIEEKCFDASVSRFYYASFQKALIFVSSYPDSGYDPKSWNSHEDLIHALMRTARDKLKISDSLSDDLHELIALKRDRISADYFDGIMEESVFNTDFMDKHRRFTKAIDILLKQIGVE